MRAAEYHTLRAMEDHHWWYAVLHQLVMKEMEKEVSECATVLDAGCGTGGMMAKLGRWRVTGIDLESLAVSHCRRRGLMAVQQGTVNELPFADASFDAVLSLDVLYHAGVDERLALAEMNRVLCPGGVLILNLPAFEWLRGAHDQAVCGVRRYTLIQVREALGQSSLKVEMIHYWNAWLVLPLTIWRWWQRAETSDLVMPPRWVNAMMTRLGGFDARCCRFLRWPLGSSVFAVARKS